MKLWIALGMCAVLPMTGCVIVADGDEVKEGWIADSSRKVEIEATMAEIDAVADLKSDSAKYEAFKVIATRDTLPPKAQAHLVKPVIEKLYAPADKMDVLLTLIANPAFSNTAKKELLAHLKRIEPEQNRLAILKAINTRGVKPAEQPAPK